MTLHTLSNAARPIRLGRLMAGLAMVLAILVGGFGTTVPALGQQREPLLIEGRQTLYQRVLSRPQATLREQPDDRARLAEPFIPPFTIYYVFDRRQSGGREWLEVGQSLRGPSEGWMDAGQVIPWRQTLVVAFSNPAGRERALLFRDREPLIELLESEGLPLESRALRRQAVTDSLPPNSPVISIEPAEHIDIAEQFYILPILEAEEVWLASGFQNRILEVASMPLEEDPLNQMPSREDLLRDFRVGIVFVIDTTNSMGPYIDRTRDAVRSIYSQIEGSPIAERVSFGMIGYRDDTSCRPELEYQTRVYAPLEHGQSPSVFLDQIDSMAPSSVSSCGFNEDAMAGVVEAINLDGWDQFDGRYIVLITDAGPRQSQDPMSRTSMGAGEVNALARSRQIAVYSLHLLTEAGTGNSEYAASHYHELSYWPNVRDLYLAVDTERPTAFGDTVDRLTESLINQVQDAMDGRLTEIIDDLEDDLVTQTQLVGRAMQLAYLGRVQGTRAPDVFRAWTADRDFEDPRRSSLEVRVLLNKNQLSDLRDTLRVIVDAGQLATLAPEDFFSTLQSAMAHLVRNPDRLGQAGFHNLGDILGEYLQDLPYTSQLLELNEQQWLSMGPGAQTEILDNIEAKLELYEEFHDRPELWVSLYEGAPEGETVFPVPLEAMP